MGGEAMYNCTMYNCTVEPRVALGYSAKGRGGRARAISILVTRGRHTRSPRAVLMGWDGQT
jgi:hypothetical protein